MRRPLLGLLVLGLLAAGCSNPLHHDNESDKVAAPRTGVCRDLQATDVSYPSNHAKIVPCSKAHTAQTFAVGTLPASTGSSYDDSRHGKFVYQTCTKAFGAYLGADDSLAMRIQMSWAWFRPSKLGWKRGARWYRCDVIGAPVGATSLRDLPERTKGMFDVEVPPDAWLTCSLGNGVTRGAKVPCSQKHTWRAVTTVKIGEPSTPYPGDRIVQVKSRDYCRESVSGWLKYPHDFNFGFTWFREPQWSTGNRRSICWAQTDR